MGQTPSTLKSKKKKIKNLAKHVRHPSYLTFERRCNFVTFNFSNFNTLITRMWMIQNAFLKKVSNQH